mmetsp:Transcript_41761/g.55019  ORF Transcript_41761/g.55019 Transcript_41761/m.55019 type:complete len:100 (+) Transcript_41761:2-301(+)
MSPPCIFKYSISSLSSTPSLGVLDLSFLSFSLMLFSWHALSFAVLDHLVLLLCERGPRSATTPSLLAFHYPLPLLLSCSPPLHDISTTSHLLVVLSLIS